MKHRNLLVIAFSTIFVTGIYVGTAGAEDMDPCKAASFETKQVEEACKTGGVKAAKTLMKTVVKQAKAAGEDVNCKTCHQSTSELHKNKGAESVQKLKSLL